MPLGLAFGVACFGASLAAIWLIGRTARARRVFDHPNERSAHAQPTPRLGGVGLVFVLLAASAAMALRRHELGGWAVILGATGAISVVGTIDDFRPIRARYRFLLQLIAASVVVASAPQRLAAFGAPIVHSLPIALVAPLAILWITWLTNLFNFMDGINGLAGTQAFVAATALAAASARGGDDGTALVLVALACASLGFVVLNFPAGWIFMGDGGSTAIGFLFGALPFAPGKAGLPGPVVGIALSMFIGDATFTLLRRVLRGERWFAAHRSHLYQRPLAWGTRHATITAVAACGMLIVAALAVHASGRPEHVGVAVAGALVVFAVLASIVFVQERSRAASAARRVGR